MTAEEKKPSGLVNSAKELRRFLIENPDLPLVVFAGNDANCGDYSYTSCSSVQAYVGEFLDCKQKVNDERCYTDRDEFEEDVANCLADSFKGTDAEFRAHVKKVVAEYDRYWKKCIILEVDN